MLAIALAVGLCATSPLPSEGGSAPVLYLIGEPTVVRSAPDSKARAVSKLATLDIVSGTATRGWLRIEGSSADSAVSGWVPFAEDNVVRGPIDALRARVFRVRDARWPMRVKLDVLRGRVRPGFTGDQVKLALGDPLKKELRTVGRDVAEEWVYADRRILFSHTGVRAVEMTAPPPAAAER